MAAGLFLSLFAAGAEDLMPQSLRNAAARAPFPALPVSPPPTKRVAMRSYKQTLPRAEQGGAMTEDEKARQTFELLLGNIIAKIRSVPEDERESWLTDTKRILRNLAMEHGLSEVQADSWAHQIEQEVRFRLAHEPNPT
jgi:hypothetical protein